MKTYQLIDTASLTRLHAHPDPNSGFPARWQLPEGNLPASPGVGLAYVPVEGASPAHDTATHTAERSLTLELDGWVIRELTPEELVARQPTLEQQLAEARSAMSGVLSALPAVSRVKFAVPRSGIEKLLDLGDVEAAYLMLSAQATDTPEETEARTLLLTALGQFLPF